MKIGSQVIVILLLVLRLAAFLAELYMPFNKSGLYYAKVFFCGNDEKGIVGSSPHL